MAKFKFRLEALKKLRKQRLLLARKEMMRVEEDLHAAAEEIKKKEEIRRSSIGLDSENLGLSIYLNSQMQLGSQKILEANQKIDESRQALDRHQGWVAHLGKELKAVEKLEEKQLSRHEEKLKLHEKRQSDDWVTKHWKSEEESRDH